MLDAALTFLSPAVCEYTLAVTNRPRWAIRRSAGKRRRTSSGQRRLYAARGEFRRTNFGVLIKEIGREDILDDPVVPRREYAKENAEGLREIAEEKLEEDVDAAKADWMR